MENIPEFMQKYYQGTDPEGQVAIERLASQFMDDKQTFYQTTFVEKTVFLNDWNKLKRENNRLNTDEALQPLMDKYEKKVKEVAIKYGYVENPQKQKAEAKQKTQLEKARQEIREKKNLHPTHEDFLKNLQSMRQRQETQKPKLT
jgi:hypothetical protein